MGRQRVRNHLVRMALASLLASPLLAQDRSEKITVAVHGTVLLNGFWNSGRANNVDVPTVALAPLSTTTRTASLGGTVRQTRITLEVRGDEILGARLFGELDVDFFGGQQPSGGGRTHPLPRVRRAYGELRWSHLTILAGQESPPIAEVSPVSLASSGFPLFAGSGNLWLWVPQLRVSGWTGSSGAVRIGIEGSLLGPSTADPQDPFLTQPDRGEQSGRPAFEGRLLARWNANGRVGTVSAGGHYGWFVGANDSLSTSRTVAASAIIPLGKALELRGEAFSGRGLAGLGGGGIGQLVAEDGSAPLRTKGGWAQVVAIPTADVELGLGAGLDDPDDSDASAIGARRKNQTWAASIALRPGPIVVGFELRRTRTTYAGPSDQTFANTHLNVTLGYAF